MNKIWKWFLNFVGKRILFLGILALLVFIALYSKGSGHMWGARPPSNVGSSSSDMDKQGNGATEKAIIIPMRFVNEVLHLYDSPCTTQEEIKKNIEKLQQKYYPQKMVIEYYKTTEDPFIPAQEAEKLLKAMGVDFVAKMK
jgi:hypothetical protein